MTECRQENFWVNESQLSFVSDQVKNSLLAQQSLCLMTIERWSHSFPFRTGQWNTLSPMIVGCISSESRTSSGSPFQNPGFERSRGFAIYERVAFLAAPSWSFFQLAEKPIWQNEFSSVRFITSLLQKRSSLKIRIQRSDKCEHRQFQEWLSKALKNLRSSRFEGKAERRRLIPSLSIPAKSDKQRLN